MDYLPIDKLFKLKPYLEYIFGISGKYSKNIFEYTGEGDLRVKYLDKIYTERNNLNGISENLAISISDKFLAQYEKKIKRIPFLKEYPNISFFSNRHFSNSTIVNESKNNYILLKYSIKISSSEITYIEKNLGSLIIGINNLGVVFIDYQANVKI